METDSVSVLASADAYTYLNGILYRHDKNNVDMKWVSELSKYWYTTQRKMQIADLYPSVKTESHVATQAVDVVGKSSTRAKEYNRISPLRESGPNQLFWCIYIAHYGYKHYLEAVHYGATNIEMREKSAISEFLSKNPKRMKNTNYKLSVSATQELAGKFMVQPRDTVDMCIAFSVYYEATIYLVYSNRYLVFYPTLMADDSDNSRESDGKLFIIYVETPCSTGGVGGSLGPTKKMENKRDYVLLDDTDENKKQRISSIKETHYEIAHYTKGLKGMSAYKVAELTIIAQKLGVDTNTSKQELYNNLLVASSI